MSDTHCIRSNLIVWQCQNWQVLHCFMLQPHFCHGSLSPLLCAVFTLFAIYMLMFSAHRYIRGCSFRSASAY